MKLILCGGGSGSKVLKSYDYLLKIIDKNKPILYIPLAMEKSRYDSCYSWFSSEIKYIKHNSFEMVRSSLELSKKDLNNYCAIFIGGGNTYKLLAKLKKNNNFNNIINYINNDGIVFGSSAGAIIFGKEINSALLDDENYIKLKDTLGFNLLNNTSILCHLNDYNLNKNYNYLKDYSKKNKTIYLSEENSIIINNNQISMIGEKKYIVFENGKDRSNKPKNFSL